MKKLFIIAAAIMLIAFQGCTDNPSTQERRNYDDGTTLLTRRFEYNGHYYIEFGREVVSSYDNYTGYVHDPDCPCGKGKN